ncbi:SpoIIIAH-like family protein [Piscibacillus salipiscarius]|uniref:SpoIIIAH-like family protein n=1 Tax=Piscibacillus salipiscarius TaxID=299480 RepID=A0ABW5Q757_9BACI|nr:SpoIIIAH-like family protein [Piscibacillus salipiscarius]
MVLKKQTVWLITMLSLLIVLSVFYMTSPNDVEVVGTDDDEQTEENQNGEDNNKEEGNENEGNENEGNENEGNKEEGNGEGEGENGDSNLDVSGMSVDDLFATTRLEKQDTREQLIEQWESVLASSNSSPEEVNEAMEEIQDIRTVAQKETILENTIRYEKDYRDVLVQKEEDSVKITVISEELSKTDANQLMQMARDEFGVMNVIVSLQEDDV